MSKSVTVAAMPYTGNKKNKTRRYARRLLRGHGPHKTATKKK